MRNVLQEGTSDGSSPGDPQTEEERAKKEKRCMARLRLGPAPKTSKGDKEAEAELLKSTIVVTSGPPPLDATELHTPTNIQLHEEVFVHYPQSALDTPASDALEANNGSLAATSPDAHGGRTGRRRSHGLQNSGWFSPDGTLRASHRGPIQHEQDHDCCPFTAIRRSEWMLRSANAVRRTSPFDWSHILSSFSVKNAFMFYPPPPTYGFVRDEHGEIQVRSQTGKRAPRLDHERIEYLRRKCRLSDKVPDDLVAGALHGIASSNPQARDGEGGSAEDDSEPSFKLIFIPWENEIQSYYIRSGSVVFGRRVRTGGPLFSLSFCCPIPCSIIRPHRRMSSHVAIFFHCNGEDIGRPSCLRLLTLANALHMTILVPEYPGYGLFEGNPSEASVKGSMERVVQFLFASDPSFTPSRLILMGHSIGTGVAVHVAKFVKKVFLKLRGSPDLTDQLPYACPMSQGQQNATDYAAAVRCPPDSFVGPFSAVPAASPTAPIPVVRNRDTHPLPEFTPPNGPLGATLAQMQAAGDDRDSASGDGDAAREARVNVPDSELSHDRVPTPLHAPYGKPAEPRRSSSTKATPPFLCPHYALGGVILLAPFASIRCVEKWQTLRDHGFDVRELERRRLTVTEDVLVPAPEEWADDANELRETGEAPPNMDFLQPSPFLFDLARYISFNRFPTIDVVRDLQNEVGFFTHTPLLLLHGAQDMLIPAIHSVAIASRVRQCTGGRSAKVYLGFLHDEGHNNLHCSHITRRFYKDVILLPHLRAQQELRDELEETLRNGLGHTNPTAAAMQRASSTRASTATAAPPQVTTAAAPLEVTVPADLPAFEPPQRAPLLRSPMSGTTNHTTEPIDEEPLEVPSSETVTKVASTSGTAAAATTAAETSTDTPLPRQPTEPYLYFIEPAYTQEGATWLENGNFSGPVRIRLLHPPPQRNSLTKTAGEAAEHRPPSRDSNIFVTRPADSPRAHSRRSCHTRSHGSACPSEEPPPFSSSPPPQQHHHHYRQRCCRHHAMQTYHVSAEFEDSLRDTLHRTQPPNASFAPAATMLHIALFHNLDHYDVGSIAVASVTKYSIDAAEALQQWRRFRRNHVILRGFIALFYFSAGSFFISLAISHGVLTHPSRLRRYLPAGKSDEQYHLDARVVIWGVLDGIGYLMLGVVRFYHNRLGLGNLSRHMDTSRAVLGVYAACRIAAYLLCAGAGIFMAMVLALTPPHRGGVDWARWSDLPYSRRVWISYLPRWTMVTSASIHMFFLIAIFLKNH